MSPRAACRLERLGFGQVYDYVLGIADWKAAGLATEGTGEPDLRVGDAIRTDIPTCEADERLAVVRQRAMDAGWDECVVVDCDGMVVGRLRDQAWERNGSTGHVMELGPTTVRPDGLLAPLVEKMSRRDSGLVLVTTPQGVLVGALRRDEADRLLAGEAREQIWADCDGCPGRWTAKK